MSVVILRKLGVSKNRIEQIRSYLPDRKKTVKENSVLSAAIEFNVGVPRGSVLGPLFIFMI